MKSIFLSIIFAFSFGCLSAVAAELDVVPRPAVVRLNGDKEFVINHNTTWRISGSSADALANLRTYLAEQFPGMTEKTAKSKNQIELRITPDSDIPAEGYNITVDKNSIVITASDAAGLFYGLQTIRQIAENNDGRVAEMTVSDAPRFPYRGVMIDVSRNFRDKEFIKKQIDALARLKLNRLHLHLTDGAGWRVEIEKYPRLTDFAAWRKGETWKQWDGTYCERTDSGAQGGYYTKDDLREIVRYAADRFITVIPEIEMPAHSEEVLAAYPELSCSGEQYGHSDFCIGNEKTFEFLQDVLDEVMEIFPSEYINIGGDEASKKAWPTCEKCQKRMADEGLKDVDELQSYLVHRIEQYLNSKGRALIGWDEIMEGGLAPNATVLSWRGPEHGIRAAQSGHNAVMAPGRFCYLDAYQDAPHTQPEAIGGYVPLEMVYSFNPAPDSLSVETRNNIKGVEATMFTEYIPTDNHAEYMLYPRMFALSEVAWTPQSQREYNDFRERAQVLNDRLKDEGYNVFDLRNEIGNRKEAQQPVDHLARGKKVIYNDCKWYDSYAASGATTLTDGIRGGWTYSDKRWQGFLTAKTDLPFDVTVDMEEETDITYIGADFMQLCPPGVWFPEKVIISYSNDGENFTELTTIHTNLIEDNKVAFRTFSWAGNIKARYIRYQAFNRWRFVFVDEIIIR
ncbi:MAG: family 20 glycosylhydrolase [Muribaculaceae bacterium]|nr:family 20 glycosylhydrolase [Muribaculaceae bacterium]